MVFLCPRILCAEVIAVLKSFASEQKPAAGDTVSERCHVHCELELPVKKGNN